MATRSAIGYALPSGKIRAVYCHWDGYPEHHLPILEEHYNSLRKVQALIRPGSMSSLRTEQLWGSDCVVDEENKRIRYTPRRDPQPLYHHERGTGPWCAADGSYGDPPLTTSPEDVAKTWRDYGCEHLYIFRPGYGWFHEEL